MNGLTLTTLLSLFVITLGANTFLPVPLRVGLRQYLLYGERLLVFDLPQMDLIADKTYGQIISFPPIYTHSGNVLYFSDGATGHLEIDTNGYTLSASTTALPPGGAPATGYLKSPASPQCYASPSAPTIQYCFNGGTPATVTKVVSGSVTATIILVGQNLAQSSFIKLDSDGILYVTGNNPNGRASTDFVLYTFQTTPTFALSKGPQVLLHTGSSGCPVEPRNCEPDTLLYMDADKGVVSYVYGNAIANVGGSIYRITLNAFAFTPCIISNATVDDAHPSVAPVIKRGGCPVPQPQPQTCNPASIPCPPNDRCCVDIRTGNRCYNPTLATCVVDNAGKTVLCGINDGACAGFCYDKRHYTCDNGVLKFIG